MKTKTITANVLGRANRRGRVSVEHGAASAHVDANRFLVIVMRTGSRAVVPITRIPVRTIADAPIEKLRTVKVSALGDHIWFPDLDEGYNVATLLEQEFGQPIRADSGWKRGSKASIRRHAPGT